MPIIKVNKSKDYTVMSNMHFRDKSLSLKAKGLLSLMFSLPSDWDYSVEGLSTLCIENQTAINSALRELKKAGYLTVTKVFPDKTKSGRIEYIYNIYETSLFEKQEGEKQGIEILPLEILPLEILGIENQGQLNTNNKLLNNKILNNKLLNNNITSAIEKFSFSDALKEKILEWLSYKKDKKQTYKERGLNTLLKWISKTSSEKGDEAVISAIEYSMRCNYSGIFEPKENTSNSGGLKKKYNFKEDGGLPY